MKRLAALIILSFIVSINPVFAKKNVNDVITPQTQLEKRQYQTRQTISSKVPTHHKTQR